MHKPRTLRQDTTPWRISTEGRSSTGAKSHSGEQPIEPREMATKKPKPKIRLKTQPPKTFPVINKDRTSKGDLYVKEFRVFTTTKVRMVISKNWNAIAWWKHTVLKEPLKEIIKDDDIRPHQYGWRLSGVVSMVIVVQNINDVLTVLHELTHAAIDIDDHCGLKLSVDNQETFAYMLEGMFEQYLEMKKNRKDYIVKTPEFK